MRTYPSSSIDIYILHLKPRQCAIVGYTPAGMCFNSVSTCHTSDTFHVCYEVMSVNTAEPRCMMRDGDRQNTGKLVDRGLVTEQSVVGAVEQSSIKKNKGKIAISLQLVSLFYAGGTSGNSVAFCSMLISPFSWCKLILRFPAVAIEALEERFLFHGGRGE